MKVKDFTLADWQKTLDEFTKDHKFVNDNRAPAAMRVENTQLTVGRYYGGMTYNKAHYTYFEPAIPGEKNPDGTQTVAWLMVRDDFLKFAAAKAKTAEKDVLSQPEQGTL